MSFKLNAYLPSKKREVLINELCYKQYRELVKSLHSANKKETILQYNSILEDLCPCIVNENITFEDKLSLLLTIRNFCVNSDLKLKCTMPDNSIYNYIVSIDSIINKVKIINKSGIVETNNIIIEYSSYKVKDEWVFLNNSKDTFVDLASMIDSIKTGEQTIVFKDLTLDERIQIVQALPITIVNQTLESIEILNQRYKDVDLLLIKNPVTNEPILKFTSNITFDILQKMVEFLYTESLNNIYRTLYNVVKHLGFTAEYADSITPIELQVYWMYFMQDTAKQKEQENTTKSNGGFNIPTTPNSELGF